MSLTPTYEHCAVLYFRQWYRNEKPCFDKIKSKHKPTVLQGLSEGIKFFRVARTAKKKHDIGLGYVRYEPIYWIIEDLLDKSECPQPYTEFVKKYAIDIGSGYGNTNLLSLTSKVLWLLFRDPILIYDSVARKTLGSPTKYIAFCDLWLSAFEKRKGQIQSACIDIRPIVQTLFEESNALKLYDDISSEQWFLKRVFDIYLLNTNRQVV